MSSSDARELTEAEREANFQAFVAHLTELTRKYGVAIKSIGGVEVAFYGGDYANVAYSSDRSSRDLYPL